VDPEINQALNELRYTLRRYRRLIALIVVAVLAAWALESTFYSVDADEQGVVLRFGRLVRKTEPGLHMKLPWPIERAIPVPVRRVQTLEFGFSTAEAGQRTRYDEYSDSQLVVARMLTGDLNLGHVEWIVQYRISDAAKFLFTIAPTGDQDQVEAVRDTIRDVSETVVRKLVGDVSVDEVLTIGRDELAVEAKVGIQEFLDSFDCGIQVVTMKLQSVSPPDPVKDAFDAVNRARQNKERVVNEAKGERNRLVPEARGKRDRAISEAEGYRERITRTALGQASAFLSKLAEFKLAPEVTRARLYLEAMEEVLNQVGDIVVVDDAVQGILPMLNLNDSVSEQRAPKGGAR